MYLKDIMTNLPPFLEKLFPTLKLPENASVPTMLSWYGSQANNRIDNRYHRIS